MRAEPSARGSVSTARRPLGGGAEAPRSHGHSLLVGEPLPPQASKESIAPPPGGRMPAVAPSRARGRIKMANRSVDRMKGGAPGRSGKGRDAHGLSERGRDDEAREEGLGKYVYCIVETDDRLDLGPLGISGNNPVYTVHHGKLAAV